MPTGDLRRDGRGRHITSHRQLLVLRGGAILIDTPGLRELQIWEGDIDSGLFVRKPALQMQIGKSVSQKKDLTGAFYISKGGYIAAGAAPDAPKYLKLGDWNTIRFEARGDTFTVWVNGHQVARYVDAGYPEAGPIGVQVHPKVGGKVEFKNVRVADLP